MRVNNGFLLFTKLLLVWKWLLFQSNRFNPAFSTSWIWPVKHIAWPCVKYSSRSCLQFTIWIWLLFQTCYILLPWSAEEVSRYQNKQTCCELNYEHKQRTRLCGGDESLGLKIRASMLPLTGDDRFPQRNTTTGVGSPAFLFSFWPR